MGKQRRPRGPRSTWEPKPAPTERSAAAPGSPARESPAHESPTISASPTIEPSAFELGDGSAGAPIPAAPVEAASPAVAPSAYPIETSPAAPPAAADDGAAEPARAVGSEPEPIAPLVRVAPMRRAAGIRIAFAPERVDLPGIGATITGYVRGEGEAAAAHLRALAGVRSPAELIRLQVGEIQRAADASLTCWSTLARKAGRAFAYR